MTRDMIKVPEPLKGFRKQEMQQSWLGCQRSLADIEDIERQVRR